MGKSSHQTINKSDGRKLEKATHTPMLKVFKDFMTQKETEHTNKDKSNQENARNNKDTYVKEKRKKRRPKSYEPKCLEATGKVKQTRPKYDNAAYEYNDHCDNQFVYQGAGGIAGGEAPNRQQSTNKYKPLYSEKRESWWTWYDRQPLNTAHKRDKSYCTTGSGVSCQFKKIFCNEYAGAIWLIVMFACTLIGAFFYAYKILWMQPSSDQLYSNPYIGVTRLGSEHQYPSEVLITPPSRSRFKHHRRNAFGDVGIQDNDMAALYESNLGGAGDGGQVLVENQQSSFHPSYALSNVVDQQKVEDQNLSPKIRNFYKRLLQTDAQIQNLKKDIFKNSQQITSHQKTKLSPYESMYRLKRSLFHKKKKKHKGNSPKTESTTSLDEKILLYNKPEKTKGKHNQISGRKHWRIFGRRRKGKVTKTKNDKRVKRFPNGTEILEFIEKGVQKLIGVNDKPKYLKCSHVDSQSERNDKSQGSNYKPLIPELQDKIPYKYEDRVEYNKNKAKELSKALLNNFTSPNKPKVAFELKDTNFDSFYKNFATKKPFKSDAITPGRKGLSFDKIENSALEDVESYEYPDNLDNFGQAYSDYGVLKDKDHSKTGLSENKSGSKSTTKDLGRKERALNPWFQGSHDSENNSNSSDEDPMTTIRPNTPKVTVATEHYTDFLNFVRKRLRLLSTKKTEESERIGKQADVDSLENDKTESMKTVNRRKREISEDFGNIITTTGAAVVILDKGTPTEDINQVNRSVKENASEKNKEAEYNHLNENDNHRSRMLLTIEEDNFNISDKNQQDSNKSKEYGRNISTISNSTPMATTTKLKKSGQEANSTSENKEVVKRNADDSDFVFWNDVYDEDYGMQSDMDENEQTERSDELKKSGNWIQDKMRKMTDSLKRKSKEEFSKLYNTKREKRTKEAGSDDHKEGFSQLHGPNNADDFDSLMDHMKQVCELASKAVRETRNLKREDEESEMTSGLMQSMVEMLSELVDYQVQQKTCLTLPADLSGFLDWLTLPQTLQATTNSKHKQAPDGSTTDSLPEEAIIDLASSRSSEKEEHSDVRSECLGTLQAVQSLMDDYAQLSEEDKGLMGDVKEYLKEQLKYLNHQLDEFNADNMDTKNQAAMNRYRGNNLQNSINKYETGFNYPGLPQNRRKKRKFINYNKRHTRITENNFESAEIGTENYKKRSVDKNDFNNDDISQNLDTIDNQYEKKENLNDNGAIKDNTSKRNLKDVYYIAVNEAKKTSAKCTQQ